jgi:hypothetical protein
MHVDFAHKFGSNRSAKPQIQMRAWFHDFYFNIFTHGLGRLLPNLFNKMHTSSMLRMKWFVETYASQVKNDNIKVLDVGSYSVNG